MNVITLDSKHWAKAEKNGAKRDIIAETIQTAANAAMDILPNVPPHVNIVVAPVGASEVIPETGDAGVTYSDEYVSIVFDYAMPYELERLRESLHSMVYHELVHAVTFSHDPWQSGMLFGAITEGLATVFERDYSNGQVPLWSKYEDDETMKAWWTELKELPETGEKNNEYFVNHSDGRKWIVYKTGTWIVDRMVASGTDLFAMMEMNHKDIVAQFEAGQ